MMPVEDQPVICGLAGCPGAPCQVIEGVGLVVCGPDPGGYRKRYWRCPTCECRTETVVIFELWYGTTAYCCRCGDGWSDGELLQRPFHRTWRRDAVRRHRQLWAQATHGPFPTNLYG